MAAPFIWDKDIYQQFVPSHPNVPLFSQAHLLLDCCFNPAPTIERCD
jgi:hypothetical protein